MRAKPRQSWCHLPVVAALWTLLMLTTAVVADEGGYEAPPFLPSIDLENSDYLDLSPDMPVKTSEPLFEGPLLQSLMRTAFALNRKSIQSTNDDVYNQQLPLIYINKRQPYEAIANSSEVMKDSRLTQRKWKKKKGRLIRYQMCYFKLCSFRPKVLYAPE